MTTAVVSKDHGPIGKDLETSVPELLVLES